MITKQQLQNKFTYKKNACRKRGIGFTLSFQEFERFHEVQPKVCDYTGVEFKLDDCDGAHYPTIERVDPNKDYCAGNILWVTRSANQCANMLFSGTTRKLDARMSQQIRDFWKSPALKLRTDYYHRAIKGVPMTEDPVVAAVNPVEENVYLLNNDVSMAEAYVQFANHFKDKQHFVLSFSDYKKLMTRKKCALTEVKFDGVDIKPSLFILDKDQYVGINNVIVVEMKTRHHLDYFINKVGLSLDGLKKVCKNMIDNLI